MILVLQTFGDVDYISQDIRALADLSEKAIITAEVKSYLQNVVTFLRMHRAVGGGVSARATQHFNLLVKYIVLTLFVWSFPDLCRCLAPLHGLNFVSPSLVALAARKIYPHRIAVTLPENERSIQYGSDLAAIASYLEGLKPEEILEEVLSQVEAPL